MDLDQLRAADSPGRQLLSGRRAPALVVSPRSNGRRAADVDQREREVVLRAREAASALGLAPALAESLRPLIHKHRDPAGL